MFIRYMKSPSTRFSLCIGALMYVSYAAAHGSWNDLSLIGVSTFIGLFMPLYARVSNYLEIQTNHLTALVTCGGDVPVDVEKLR